MFFQCLADGTGQFFQRLDLAAAHSSVTNAASQYNNPPHHIVTVKYRTVTRSMVRMQNTP